MYGLISVVLKMEGDFGTVGRTRNCIDLTNEPDNDLINTGPSTVSVSFQTLQSGQKRIEVAMSQSNNNIQWHVSKKPKTCNGSMFSSGITQSPSPSSSYSECTSFTEEDYGSLMYDCFEDGPSKDELDAFMSMLPSFQYLGQLDTQTRGRKWVECLDNALVVVGYDKYRLFLPEIKNTLGGPALEWWKKNVSSYSNWTGIKHAFIRKFLSSSSPALKISKANHNFITLRTNDNVCLSFDKLAQSSTPRTVYMNDSEINTSRNLFTMSVVVKDKVLNCLLDSASNVNMTTFRTVELTDLLNQTKHLDLRHSPTFSKRYNTLLSSSVKLPIEFPGYGETEIKHSTSAYVAQALDQYDLVLGLPFIRQHAQAINWTTHTFYHRRTFMNKNPFLSETA